MERNDTDPLELHHFQIRGYIVRKGRGAGTHSNAKCLLCGKYAEDPIHDYEDPVFAAMNFQVDDRQHRIK